MKIAIIGNGFTGSTIPLAHHLSEIGYEVDCYYLVFEGLNCIESLDFDRVAHGGEMISIRKSNTIYNYLSSSVNIYLLPNYAVFRKQKVLLFGYWHLFKNKRRVKRYASEIISRHYDKVYIIVHTSYEVQLCQYLKQAGVPFVIVYHEVLKDHLNNRTLKEEVKNSIKFGTEIVVHSERSKNDITDNFFDKSINRRIHVIPFGPFESYLAFPPVQMNNIPTDYFLFLGSIKAHKGLKYLYEAFYEDEILKKCHVVIAGRGKDPVLDKIKSNHNFTLINQYISNWDLVNLMANCKAVICPYLSGSQSGLVQTAAVFDKPVIATDVGAFREIIIDGNNGFIAKPGNSNSLASAVKRFMDSHMNVVFSDLLPQKYHWNEIVKQYKKEKLL